MKNKFLLLAGLVSGIGLFSCQKDNEPEPVIPGMALIGVFQVPNNKNITFDMQNIDGFASVGIKHDEREFLFANVSKGAEINKMGVYGQYLVKLKTYSKGNDTEVSYSLAESKSGDVIFTYVGSVKRVK